MWHAKHATCWHIPDEWLENGGQGGLTHGVGGSKLYGSRQLGFFGQFWGLHQQRTGGVVVVWKKKTTTNVSFLVCCRKRGLCTRAVKVASDRCRSASAPSPACGFYWASSGWERGERWPCPGQKKESLLQQKDISGQTLEKTPCINPLNSTDLLKKRLGFSPHHHIFFIYIKVQLPNWTFFQTSLQFPLLSSWKLSLENMNAEQLKGNRSFVDFSPFLASPTSM